MEELEFNGVFKYKKDVNSKTIYLSKEHLKNSSTKILKTEGMLHHVTYDGIKQHVKNHLEQYENSGYKIVFEHEGKIILLLFNK